MEYLSGKGLETIERDVTEFEAEQDFDLVLISHLTADRPLIEENLAEDGYVICDTFSRARSLDEMSFSLQAVYSEELKETDELQESQKYLFSI